ncbi:hypothetical protein K435DRAFT_855812 [Dendrothele bispora CBS 962.96]|uniref:Uncharacterized protein n=1 Tax=Dendrothele bispora (strain CBS 962.96) TaxID=1314807 RepID=A0A4S8M9Z9_DENBC|nr:hypothetical protein K435DRAFT_855812 [Dendrothele bispora CBS 962.96]
MRVLDYMNPFTPFLPRLLTMSPHDSPAITFDFDHHKLGDSEEIERFGHGRGTRRRQITTETCTKGETGSLKRTAGADTVETTDVIEEDTVTTSAAMSVPISIVVPASTVPTSCAISNRSLSFGEGLQEEDKVGGEEGKVEGAGMPLLLPGAPSPPKSTNLSTERTQALSSHSVVVELPSLLPKPELLSIIPQQTLLQIHFDKETKMISRPNLLTPPMLLPGTMDGDGLRWPDSSTLDTSVSRSCLVDVPLSPFDLAPHAQILQRISSCKQAQVDQTNLRTGGIPGPATTAKDPIATSMTRSEILVDSRGGVVIPVSMTVPSDTTELPIQAQMEDPSSTTRDMTRSSTEDWLELVRKRVQAWSEERVGRPPPLRFERWY